jgi:hypothetical protein
MLGRVFDKSRKAQHSDQQLNEVWALELAALASTPPDVSVCMMQPIC